MNILEHLLRFSFLFFFLFFFILFFVTSRRCGRTVTFLMRSIDSSRAPGGDAGCPLETRWPRCPVFARRPERPALVMSLAADMRWQNGDQLT